MVEQEMEALEKECAQKLSELQAELAQLRADKDADEKNFVQALELKEAQVQAVRAELERLEQRAAQQATETEALRLELARVEESKDAVWTHAASETQQSAQVVEALRTELREAQSSLATAKRELADSKVAMFARQSQLEKTNAELSTTVAALERELAKARETGGAGTVGASVSVGGGGDAASTQLQEDYRKVQHALVLAKKALQEESRKLEQQRQETARLSGELQRLKDDATAGESETARQLLAATRENEQLTERLRAVQTETARSTAAASEARIQTLTNRLMEKQETLEALRGRATALEVRLSDAQSRAERAERRAAEMERSGGVPLALDLDGGDTLVRYASGGSTGLRRGKNRMAHALGRVAPVVQRSARVVTALDALDRWLLVLGRAFLGSPVARLALLAYVALLHAWVFVVLSFHTSHLKEEVQAGGGRGGGGGGGGGGVGGVGVPAFEGGPPLP
ncbi:hypothetical protein PINS_up007506 [Pythium insidiosum]|nr:hypothetical protein PINS_up007506 [Pythium insidiosum]